jgi:hypothetical protein
MLCGRCGAANVAGDQFCGSCGAFLEWVADPDAPIAPVPVTADAAPPASTTPGTLADPGAPTTAPTAPAPPLPAETEDEAGVVRCAACGIANPVGRTFCQTCGATLATAVVAGAIGRGWTGLPPPAPTGSATGGQLTTSPVPAASPRARRGIPGWVVVVAVLGIVVGAAVVGGSVFLKQATEPSAAAVTAPPGSRGSPGVTPSASSSGPAASISPRPPVKAVTLTPTGATASSVVGDRPKFDAAKAIDGDRKTAWQEGTTDEAGQWIEVTFPKLARIDAVLINNGYQVNVAAYQGNRRLRDVRVSVNGGRSITVRLKDDAKQQRINLGGIADATSVRIEIVSTYPPKKTSYAGSPFDDAAVSEIAIVGVPAA